MSQSLNLLFALGRPFSPFYSAAMKLREELYARGILSRKKLEVPVISVGNLVLGGTGKSPTVAHIAQLLTNHGYHPAIISRGYRGRAKERVNIVSDGEAIRLSPELAGDEPYMLAETLPDVPVLTGSRRFFPGNHAVAQFGADVILLDDGFQHLGLERDIDVVLFDGTTLAGNSRVFPGGPLREPVSALNRCHVFIITGVTEVNRKRTEYFRDLLNQRFADKTVYTAVIAELVLLNRAGEEMAEVHDAPCSAFCGIANPIRFRDAMDKLGLSLTNFHSFRDHIHYEQAQLNELCREAKRSGAKFMVTTAKDYVKLKHLHCELPLYRLKVINRIDKSFDDYILQRLRQTG